MILSIVMGSTVYFGASRSDITSCELLLLLLLLLLLMTLLLHGLHVQLALDPCVTATTSNK